MPCEQCRHHNGLPAAEGRRRIVRRPRLGAYIHVPFCELICPFCPYNKVLAEADLARRYFAALHREIDWYVAEHGDAPFTSMYIGGGTHLDITRSATGTADEQTQAAWQVTDIRAEVANLRSRGVMVQDYDIPGLKTEDGIADIGFAWAAWVIDPGKNALGILQLKQ